MITTSTAPETLFFAAAHNAFRQAETRHPDEAPVFHFELAGHVIQLRFAGLELVPLLTPAFAHLACEPVATPALTICLWDDASAGVTTPEPPPASDTVGTQFVDGLDVKLAWEPATGALTAFDQRQRLGLCRYPNVKGVEDLEQAAPARKVIHWWAASLGFQRVHAAAVGTPDGGVLLVGRSGSGKSTTSLSCIGAFSSVGSGLGFAADDYCLLSFPEHGPPLVHSVYATGKADSDSVGRLPGHLQEAFSATRLCDASKMVLFLAETFPGAVLRSFPLRALVFPHIGDRNTRADLEPMSPMEALRAVAPSTIFQMPGERAAGFSRLSAVVRAVPCHRLQLGPDPTHAHHLLLGLCQGAA
jgi:hypothetical protein